MASGLGGGGLFSTGTNDNYVCEAFALKHFLSPVTQKCNSTTQTNGKKTTKQLILTEQDQFLRQCEAAISLQQQPLQAAWLTDQWFWKISKRKSRRRRPPSTVYIFLYIFKLRFNLHSHLSFDSFLLTHGKIKNCCCGSIIGKSGCQSPPALHRIF